MFENGRCFVCRACGLPVFVPASCQLRAAESPALAEHFFFIEEKFQYALSCPRCLEQRFEELAKGTRPDEVKVQ